MEQGPKKPELSADQIEKLKALKFTYDDEINISDEDESSLHNASDGNWSPLYDRGDVDSLKEFAHHLGEAVGESFEDFLNKDYYEGLSEREIQDSMNDYYHQDPQGGGVFDNPPKRSYKTQLEEVEKNSKSEEEKEENREIVMKEAIDSFVNQIFGTYEKYLD